MNDLFARLAARATGDVPLLRPRPVSRFAAFAPTSQPGFDTSAVAAPDAPPHTGRIQQAALGTLSPVTAEPPRQAQVVAVAAPAVSPPGAADMPLGHADAVPADSPLAADTSAHPPGGRQRADTMLPWQVDVARRAAQTSATTADAVAATGVSARRGVPLQLVRGGSVPQTEAADAGVHSDLIAARRDVGAARRELGTAPLLSLPGPAPVEVFGARAAAVSPPDAPAAPAPTDGPLPVVEITIGRIDVRAVQPEAPARKPQQRPARLGLDEYLRRRPGAP